MRWLVLGAGALGGYFGGRLLEAGEDVTFLLRPRRLALIRATGLTIESPYGNTHIEAPHCITGDAIDGTYDVVLLGCKAYDLDSAMDAIAPAIGATTAIIPFLNGMAHIDRLGERFGAEHVLGGVCMISAALDGQGTIRHFNRLHTLLYGELDGSRSPRIEAIEAAFAPANADARASDTIVQDMWEKWVVIASLAGSNCLLRAAVGDIVRAGAADIAMGIFDESARIAAANGHPPRAYARERAEQFVADADSTVTASMLKDVERNAPVEGEHIIGDLIARAPPDITPLRLLPVVYAHLRAYAARRAREGGH